MKAPTHSIDSQLSAAPLVAQPPSDQAQRSIRRRISAWLQQRSQGLISSMVGSTGPQIRQLQNGNLRWRAYDPISGQAAHFTSEHELRQWLEQRYYR